jgi:hypothetical protein
MEIHTIHSELLRRRVRVLVVGVGDVASLSCTLPSRIRSWMTTVSRVAAQQKPWSGRTLCKPDPGTPRPGPARAVVPIWHHLVPRRVCELNQRRLCAYEN